MSASSRAFPAEKLNNSIELEKFLIEINESSLSAVRKSDATKIICCLQYIKNNLPLIEEAANRWNACLADFNDPIKTAKNYENSKFFKTHFKNLIDFKNGVLRDTGAVAFHIHGYQKGEHVVAAFLETIKEIEEVLPKLTLPQRIRFAAKLEYDPDPSVRCLDGRTGRGLKWAKDIVNSPALPLGHIMEMCQEAYESEGHSTSCFAFFKKYCNDYDYTRYYDPVEKITKLLTDETIQQYLQNILGEEVVEETKEEQEEKQIEPEKPSYEEYIPSMHAKIGKKNLIQIHFNAPNETYTLRNKISTKEHCPQGDNHTCNVVRLSPTEVWLHFRNNFEILTIRVYKSVIEIESLLRTRNYDVLSNLLGTIDQNALELIWMLIDKEGTPLTYFLSHGLHHTILNKLPLWSHSNTINDFFTYNQDRVILAVVEKLYSSTCEKMILHNPSRNRVNSLLTYLLQTQSSLVSSLFLKKLSPAAVRTALFARKFGDTYIPFQQIAESLSPQKFKEVLDALHYSVDDMHSVELSNLNDLDWRFLFDALLHQPSENIMYFCNLLTPQSLALVHSYFKKNILQQIIRIRLRALIEKMLDIHNREAVLFEFKSNLQQLIQSYDATHSPNPKAEPYPLTPSEEKSLAMFREGKAIIKAIQDKNWPNYLTQLSNPFYRPKLRVSACKTGYKYIHLTGETILMRPLHQSLFRKQTKTYQRHKKTSFTRVSKNLHTPIFMGLSMTDKPTAGVAYAVDNNPEKVSTNIKIDAMFRANSITVQRPWVSSTRVSAKQYERKVEHTSFKNLNDFDNCIDNQPGASNEMLVEANVAAEPILFIDSNPLSRPLALARHKTMQAELKIDPPIVVYDPEYRTATVYSKKERELEESLEDLANQAFPPTLSNALSAFFKPPTSFTFNCASEDSFIIPASEFANARRILHQYRSKELSTWEAFSQIKQIATNKNEVALNIGPSYEPRNTTKIKQH